MKSPQPLSWYRSDTKNNYDGLVGKRSSIASRDVQFDLGRKSQFETIRLPFFARRCDKPLIR